MLYYKLYILILYYLYYYILNLAFQFYGIKFFIKSIYQKTIQISENIAKSNSTDS